MSKEKFKYNSDNTTFVSFSIIAILAVVLTIAVIFSAFQHQRITELEKGENILKSSTPLECIYYRDMLYNEFEGSYFYNITYFLYNNNSGRNLTGEIDDSIILCFEGGVGLNKTFHVINPKIPIFEGDASG